MKDDDKIIVNCKKARYYANDLFDRDVLVPCDEQLFNDCVVRFRHRFEVSRDGYNRTVYYDKTVDMTFVREWIE